MGAVEFFSKVIDAVVWPLTLVMLLLLFRPGVRKVLDELADRIKAMTSFRGPAGVGADFDSRVLDVREDARILSTTTQQHESQGRQETAAILLPADLSVIDDFDIENLAFRAEKMPRTVIIESWLYLEEALNETARRLDIPDAGKRGVGSLLRELATRVPSAQISNAMPVINELRALRNQAAHSMKMELSPLAAYDYAITALRLAILIKAAPIPAQRAQSPESG